MPADDASSRTAPSARKGRTTALVIGIGAALVAVAAALLVQDQRQRVVLAVLAAVTAAIWLLLAPVLERALAAAAPPAEPPARGRRPSGAQPAPVRPAIAPWAYFVTVAFGVAGAGAGLNLVGYNTSTIVGTAAQLTAAAAGCGFFLLVYLLVSRWWRGRRR